jgi:hypothetical protein
VTHLQFIRSCLSYTEAFPQSATRYSVSSPVALVLIHRFVLPSVISMNLSFDVISPPFVDVSITMVLKSPGAGEFHTSLHYICSEDVRRLPSCSVSMLH